MAEQNGHIRHGYSNIPVYDELMWKLSELAGEWRETKQAQLVRRYHHVLLTLLEMGWEDELDVELLLPRELMPAEYFQRYQQPESSSAD